jgi:membrane protease YdiL (CAAX protease family)
MKPLYAMHEASRNSDATPVHEDTDMEGTPGSDENGTASSRTIRFGYWSATRSATYGFLAALPLFGLYESLILLVNADRLSHVRVGADLWIKQLMALLEGVTGGSHVILLGVPVVLAGLFVFLHDRKRRPPIRPAWFGWLIGESLVYATGVAFLVSTVVGLIFALHPMLGSAGHVLHPALMMQEVESLSAPAMLVLSIGAGLYEELVFRVLLVGGLFWIFRKRVARAWLAYALAAVIGAFLFSAVHYMGPLGDPFTLASFTFRLLFGLALNAVFLLRGFGVAAWTHALYDVLVVTQILG